MSDKLYYVTKSLQCGNAIIRSLSDTPGGADLMFLQKYDGPYLSGTPDWSFLYNTSKRYTWRQVVNSIAYPPAIISDKNIKILTINKGEVFNIRGFAIIGDRNQKNQYGLYDPTPDRYYGCQQYINNIKVLGCGNTGIHLQRGLEVTTMRDVVCRYNMGYGLFTGKNACDSATEYLRFDSCDFSYNRLSGVYFSYWRKDINFVNCQFSGNGQYQLDQIDSVLGYDRRLPSRLSEVHAGVWLDNGNIEADNTSFGFSMIDCYGENCLLGLHMTNTVGRGVTNSVELKNNIFYRGDAPKPNSYNGSCFYIDTNYISKWLIKGNYGHALDVAVFKKTPIDGGHNEIHDIDLFEAITNKLYTDTTLFKDILGDGSCLSRHEISKDFTLTVPSGYSNQTACYSLTAHWQSHNSDAFSGYILMVTTMPSGHYKMLTIASDNISGFASKPTISSNGVLTIPSVQYYRYTLQRIDLTKTIY